MLCQSKLFDEEYLMNSKRIETKKTRSRPLLVREILVDAPNLF